jgi:hypothetical protein
VTGLPLNHQMTVNLTNKALSNESRFENGSVSREKVNERSRELALNDGRSPGCVSQADYEQAKWELTGERDIDRQEAILNAIENVDCWSLLFGSTGRKMPVFISEEGGRIKSDRFV